jgi:murein DD-endopeptidase MepM/ murein hydrolase activator NlpD
LYSKLGDHFLKPEITQKVKLVHTLDTHQDLQTSQSSANMLDHRSGLAKIAALFGNRRSRSSALMLGLAILMGISNFPANYLNPAIAAGSATKSPTTATPAVTTSGEIYVNQLRSDVAAMRSQPVQSSVLVAQAFTPRSSPQSFTNQTQFTGEVSVPIEVAQPKTKTFRPVAASQPYPTNSGPYGDIENRYPSTNGETTIGFSWPAAGKLTSRFGRRWGRMHKGIDIAGPVGTPINAAADGTIIFAGWHSGGYGNLVEIRHSDGTTTRYGHNSRLSVAIGQTVRQGQQLAEMGSTGNSTGSHLHFEIRPSGGNAVNPISHLPANS